MADITAILTATQSADAGARQAAEEQLKNAQESNLAGFLTGLASELANEQKPPEVRRLAGLILTARPFCGLTSWTTKRPVSGSRKAQQPRAPLSDSALRPCSWTVRSGVMSESLLLERCSRKPSASVTTVGGG